MEAFPDLIPSGRLWLPLYGIEGVLGLDGRDVVEIAVEALGGVSVHPSGRREFEVLGLLPWSGSGGSTDELGLVVPVDGLGQCVDAPSRSLSRSGHDFEFFVGGVGGVGGWQESEEFAGEVALQAADDLALRHALGGAAGDVVDRRLMLLHPHGDDSVERCVGLAVPATVPAVSAVGLA